MPPQETAGGHSPASNTPRGKFGKARSAGGAPTVGKRNKGPSQPVVVCRFGWQVSGVTTCIIFVMRGVGSERDHDYADTAGKNMQALSAGV